MSVLGASAGATVGAVVGGTGMLGALLIASGLAPRSVRPFGGDDRAPSGGDRGPRASWTAVAMQPASIAVAFASLAAGWVVTGWPALGVNLAIGSLVVRVAADASRRRRRQDAIAEALAAWAEMLADVIRSHAALGQAVRDTVDLVPDEIAPAVRTLAARTESGSLVDGLIAFAAEVEHPGADAMTAALLVAADGRGGDVPTVLDRIASRTRVRTELELRIAAGRTRHYTEARTMAVMTLVLAAVALVAGRPYLSPYDGMIGQFVLLLVGALFAAAGVALIELGRPEERFRLVPVAEGVSP